MIENQPLACVPTHCGRARVTAKVHASEAPRSVRVYFRAPDQTSEYYIEMMKGTGDDYWAILPATADATSAVVYRVAARDSKGAETSTDSTTVPVTGACAGAELSPGEISYASNMALGLTSDSQSAVPGGFRCAGIQSQISSTGEVLKPNENCRQILLANADEACDKQRRPIVAASTAAVSPAEAAGLVAAGAAAAAGGAVVYQNNRGSEKPVSSLRPRP
ncbi:MAG TPA: hypothetical protein VHL58_11345 [Thermoanaerobaculia bacterium]|nr:hypothetical protein [Thermoanaerobaculia bacterium]